MTTGFKTTRFGAVEVSDDDLSAQCHRCDATIRYVLGMRLSEWNALLRAFIGQHRTCGMKRLVMKAGG